jgi:hypothetical protein
MLLEETVAVHYENHTEHADTVRTSPETHYVSTTKINRLMMLGETVTVYCDNHTKHSAHPNDLILPLLEPPDLRRLRRFLPNDLLTRF